MPFQLQSRRSLFPSILLEPERPPVSQITGTAGGVRHISPADSEFESDLGKNYEKMMQWEHYPRLSRTCHCWPMMAP